MMKKTAIDYLLSPVNRFLKNEVTGGIVLFVSAATAMVLANSPLADEYHAFWKFKFSLNFAGCEISNNLHHWVNDGLMAVFFFVVGLELKREVIGGQLSDWRTSVLPVVAAVGGMVFPALIYVAINMGQESVHGWGIPMATDIAFALGVMYLLGDRVLLSIKIFLTALAITDDIGAVLVIAFFYTSNISFESLAIGSCFMAALIGGNLLGVRSPTFYGILGIGGLWLAFLLSGVHATIAGVLAALAIPATVQINEKNFISNLRIFTDEFEKAKPNDNSLVTPVQLHIIDKIKSYAKAAETPLQRLEHAMHPLVAYIIMPVFALANAGITLTGDIAGQIASPVTIGVMAGLLFGKFLGIVGLSRIAVYFKWAKLPEGANWRHIYGVALLASIGFTMSLFITELAFRKPVFALEAKLGILIASLIGGTCGYLLLRFSEKKK